MQTCESRGNAYLGREKDTQVLVFLHALNGSAAACLRCLSRRVNKSSAKHHNPGSITAELHTNAGEEAVL